MGDTLRSLEARAGAAAEGAARDVAHRIHGDVGVAKTRFSPETLPATRYRPVCYLRLPPIVSTAAARHTKIIPIGLSHFHSSLCLVGNCSSVTQVECYVTCDASRQVFLKILAIFWGGGRIGIQ